MRRVRRTTSTNVPTDRHALPDTPDAETPVPKVSVVIPTYNREAMLPRAVRSVLSQTFEDLELIVVDDHSDDRTPDVLAGFVDKRIRSLRHPRNMGQSKALNTGINAARGEYVAFLDDDDVWLPKKLALQVDALDDAPPEVGLVYGWRHIMDDETNSLLQTVQQTLRGDIFEQMLALETPVPPSSWLMRTTVVRALEGFDGRLHRDKDVEFACRFSERGWHVDYVPRVVLLKCSHTKGQMTDPTPENLAAREAFTREHLRRFKADLRKRPATRARAYRRLAEVQFPYRRFRGAVSIAHAMLADPEKWTTKIGRYSRVLCYRLRDATRTNAKYNRRLSVKPDKPTAILY